jgi:large repetitive protein
MEPLGSIAGNVKEDVDMDEIGDRNIPNVLIQLLDRTGFMIKSTVTDSNGNYLFTDLTADIYVVRERNILEVPFDVSDIDRGNKNAILVKIGLNGAPLDSSGNDFVDKKGPMVTGLVLEDVDDDTIGDNPIPGVVITLRESNTTVSTTLTDSLGRFIFAADPAKVYSVVEINKSGYSDVTDSDGNDPNYIDNVSSAGKDNIFVDKRKMLR